MNKHVPLTGTVERATATEPTTVICVGAEEAEESILVAIVTFRFSEIVTGSHIIGVEVLSEHLILAAIREPRVGVLIILECD